MANYSLETVERFLKGNRKQGQVAAENAMTN